MLSLFTEANSNGDPWLLRFRTLVGTLVLSNIPEPELVFKTAAAQFCKSTGSMSFFASSAKFFNQALELNSHPVKAKSKRITHKE
jgi:hypothetical protein